MSNRARRFLLLVSGTGLLSAPGPAWAGGHLFGHPHHYHSSSTTVTTGVVPASSYVGVTPAASYIGVIPASSYVGVMPATMSPMAVVPIASHAPMAPAASYASHQAASAQAFAASPSEAQQAMSSYPTLAAAAQGKNLDGGRFIVFLRGLIKGTAAELGGPNGAGVRSVLKTALIGFVKTTLAVEPGGGLIVTEIDALLNEFFGGGGAGPATGSTLDGNSFTIRVTIEGNKVTVVPVNPGGGGGSGGGSVVSGGSGGLPSMAPASGLPNPQSPASSQKPNLGVDGVMPAPMAPSASPPAPGPAEDTDAKRHEEVMSTLTAIAKSLEKIADKPR